MIAEYHRFEGVSDPGDMSIVYAIETRSGIRGTLVDAFGVYADPRVGAFVKEVALRRTRQDIPSREMTESGGPALAAHASDLAG